MRRFTAWLARRDAQRYAKQDDHMASLCVLNADAHPYMEHFWLSEAKRYAERAQEYRRGSRG